MRRRMQTLDVVEVMRRAECDEQSLFLAAHVYVFGATEDVSNDVAQFKMHCVIPFYVLTYVEDYLESDI
jgi:hypothetical protein